MKMFEPNWILVNVDCVNYVERLCYLEWGASIVIQAGRDTIYLSLDIWYLICSIIRLLTARIN